jgi:cysteine desulfurase
MELAAEEMPDAAGRLAKLRDRLERGIRETISQALLNGHPEKRLPHILNMGFPFVSGEVILIALDTRGVAVSSGSACTSGSLEPSHVLQAMGVPPAAALGSLRFSLGHDNTDDEISFVIESLADIVERVREVSAVSAEGGVK